MIFDDIPMKCHNLCHLKPPPIEPMTWSPSHWITGPLGWPKALVAFQKQNVTHALRLKNDGILDLSANLHRFTINRWNSYEFLIFVFLGQFTINKQHRFYSSMWCIQNFHVGSCSSLDSSCRPSHVPRRRQNTPRLSNAEKPWMSNELDGYANLQDKSSFNNTSYCYP